MMLSKKGEKPVHYWRYLL